MILQLNEMFDYLSKIDTQFTLLLNGSDSEFIDLIAITATKTSTWIPLAVVLLYVVVRSNNWKNVCIFVLGVALAITLADQVASGVFKPLVARLRPSHERALQGLIDLVNGYRGGRYGFFSSHAANTCAVSTFVALLYKNKGLTVALYSWTLLNCWTRAYLGVHYVSDLLVGLLWGLCVGFMLHFMIRKFYVKYSPQIFQNIFTTSRANVLINALMLTYLSIVVYAIVVG
jgi:undecaprenyl-diphosphatase